MPITREQFEAILPAMADPTGALYGRALPHLERIEARARAEYNTTAGTLPPGALKDFEDHLRGYACNEAVYHLMPHLDLVATPTGFGIVSNQHVAPASPHRVAALREELRKEASRQRDAAREVLRSYGRLTIVTEYVRTLLYAPTLARRYGLHTESRAKVYHDEYEELLPALTRAEARTEQLIGTTLYRTLIDHLRHPADEAHATTEAARRLLHPARTLVASIALGRDYRPELQDFYARARLAAQEDTEHPETYLQIMSIINRSRYANHKDDPCFFFS